MTGGFFSWAGGSWVVFFPLFFGCGGDRWTRLCLGRTGPRSWRSQSGTGGSCPGFGWCFFAPRLRGSSSPPASGRPIRSALRFSCFPVFRSHRSRNRGCGSFLRCSRLWGGKPVPLWHIFAVTGSRWGRSPTFPSVSCHCGFFRHQGVLLLTVTLTVTPHCRQPRTPSVELPLDQPLV